MKKFEKKKSCGLGEPVACRNTECIQTYLVAQCSPGSFLCSVPLPSSSSSLVAVNVPEGRILSTQGLSMDIYDCFSVYCLNYITHISWMYCIAYTLCLAWESGLQRVGHESLTAAGSQTLCRKNTSSPRQRTMVWRRVNPRQNRCWVRIENRSR